MLLLFGILLSLGGFAVILLGQGVIGGVLVVLGIAAVAAALLFTAGRSKDQTGENTELSRLEQEMEELEAQVCIEEGQIEDFCTRWGLREGLELTSWLVELQNKRRDYEALLERQKQAGSDEKTARIAALQKDLQQFLQNTEKYRKHKTILQHCMNWRESADRDSFYWKNKRNIYSKSRNTKRWQNR